MINGVEYVSVKYYGARGNGNADDRLAIQQAFNENRNVYFPKGVYSLKSKSDIEAFLVINNKTKVENIFCESNSVITLDKSPTSDYIKPAIIGIMAWDENKKIVRIKGLSIDGNRIYHNLQTTGIVVFEKNCFSVEELYLDNIFIYNNNGGGIHTEANRNYFNNITTENCLSHGIGINNTTCPKIVHEFYLNNYFSFNDQSYTIDFGGPEPKDAPTKSLADFFWKGKVRNVRSINSLYGIKTAGYWDLELDSIFIDGSKNNGFYISKDAPDKKVKVSNMFIKNAKANGLYLSGQTNFFGNNIYVENCNVLVQIDKTDIDIDGLYLDGKGNNIATLRMGSSNVKINNFEIKNNGLLDEYSVWVQGRNISLINGVFININGVAPLILHESSDQIKLKNLVYHDWENRSPKLKNSLMVIKKVGDVNIESCDFINLKNIKNISKVNIKISEY